MSEPDSAEVRLGHQCKIADARLDVAEDVGWLAAALGALAAFFKWESWLLAIGAGIAIYLVATWRHSRERARAWDNYERATGTGKHLRLPADRAPDS